MIAELICLGVGGVALLAGYARGRVDKAREIRKQEELKRKADAICDPLPEEVVLYTDTVTANGVEQRIEVSCTKCPCSSHWALDKLQKGGWLRLCTCESWPKEHFHNKCISCGARTLIRAKTDVDPKAPPTPKAKAPEPPQPGVDYNACSCGSDRAKSAKLPSGVEGWQCLDCNCLRPKLIGGVTPISTN